MNKEFIPYEQALKLKALGFDEPCLAFYDGKGDSKIYYNSLRNGSGDYEPFTSTERLTWVGAPLYQQVFRWFREKYNIVNPQKLIFQTIGGSYGLESIDEHDQVDGYFDAYEEAELACLKKFIENVK